MTTNPPPSSDNTGMMAKVGRWLRKPSTLIVAGGVTLVGTGLYLGGQQLAYRQASPFLEAELSRLLGRPVQVGEVEAVNFFEVNLGPSQMPPTADDPTAIALEKIKVTANPWLFLVGQPIEIEATLIRPRITLEQGEDGQWTTFELPRGDDPFRLPVDINAKINLEEAEVSILPYGLPRPLAGKIDGQVSYQYLRQDERQAVGYDLDIELEASQISAKGTTDMTTGESETALEITRLNLPQLARLLPQSPLTVQSGQLTGDVKASLPGWQQIEGLQALGELELTQLQARIDQVKDPLKADFKLNLAGQRLIVERGRLDLGPLKTEVQGAIAWGEGYNLSIKTNAVDAQAFSNTLNVQLPVRVEGKVKAQMQVKGPLANPQLQGRLENVGTVTVDRVVMDGFRTDFRGDLDQLSLQQLRIQPQTGGNIQGQAQAKWRLRDFFTPAKAQQWRWQTIPVQAQLTGAIATMPLLAVYNIKPDQTNVGNLRFSGKADGTLGNPKATVQWQTPDTSEVAGINFVARGEATLVGQQFTLKNTEIRSNGGNLRLTGQGNFRQDRWQAEVNTQAFPLTPFVQTLCDLEATPLCPTAIRNKPLTLMAGQVNLTGQLSQFDADRWQGTGQFQLRSGGETAQINASLQRGQIQADLAAQNVAVNPYVTRLTAPVTLDRLTAQTQFPLEPLLEGQLPLDRLSWQSQLRGNVDNRPVTATTEIRGGQFQTRANLGNIALNPWLPTLPVATRLTQGQVNARAFIGDLQTFPDLQRLGLNRVVGDAQLRLMVADSPVSVNGELERGSLTAIANVGQLSLNALAPQIPVPARVDRGEISLIANVNDLIQPQADLRQLEAIATVDLTVAGGQVTSLSRLDNLAWQSRITAQNLNLDPLLPPQVLQAGGNLDPANAQASLSGNLSSLFTPQGQLGTLPITVDQSQITSGGQRVTAQGQILVGNLAQRPQLSTVNLNVTGDLDLAKLPVNEVLATLPIAEEFKPDALDLVGQSQFTGTLTGQRVTTLAGLRLAGQATVNNLALNDYGFEPRLIGPLSAQVGQPISLNLQGQQDQLAFQIEPCRGQCLSPYLPTSFTIRQAYNRPEPILAQGQLDGDRLQVNVEQFPLAVLNVRPARRYTIEGRLEGDLQAQMSLNLRDGHGRGNLLVSNPTVGYLGFDELNADLAYQNQVLQLNQGHVIIGESQYNAQASLNFRTQAIAGNVSVRQAQIGKLLTALRVSDVESFLRLVQRQQPALSPADAIDPISAGDPNQALENQLNLLYLIDQQIIALAQEYERGGIPQELNIVGTFDGDINLAGTLQSPVVGVNVEGRNWSWYPQAVFPNIIPPLGLVLNETRFLPIRQVKLQAQFREGQIAILPSFVQIKNSRLGAEGIISPQASRLQWLVQDFDSDILEAFFQVPGAVGGRLNAQGDISGTPANPQFSGVFNFDEITLNARPVEEVIGGQFNYQDHRLQVVTSEASPLYFNAQVPFYFDAEQARQSDRPQTFRAELNIPPDSLELLDIVSQEQLVWLSGDGTLNLKVEGELNQDNGLRVENLNALGKVTLTAAVIKSTALPTPVQIDGEIYFNNTAIAIEQLTGKLDQSRIDIAGVLPLFDPQPGLENPLQISIKPTRIDLPNLYAGNFAGLINIEGAAFQPIITGDVQLSDGQVFVPDRLDQSEPDQLAQLRTQLGWFKARRPEPLISPNLDNLSISLRNLYIEQDPLYVFSFGGDFNVSGPVLDFAALSADGAIQLNRGRVSFFDTRFLLDRRSPNTITFKPDQDLLNPDLNIAMRTIVSDLPQSARMRSENTSEYPDDSLSQIQRVDIRLVIDGNLGQILPNLNPRYAAVCDPTVTFRPLPGVGSFDEFQLDRLSRCLQILAAQGFDNEQIFSNPAITLSSSPPRSEGEIVRLLGEQVIVLVDALQGKNSSQLLQVGITQLAIPMIFQGLVYDVETAISDTVGSTDFRVVPFLEAIYQIEEQGYMRFTYDYSFNELRVRYEKQF